jgi:SNF2 family DNA or RNA helicase
LQYIKESDEAKTLHVGSELIQMDENAVDGIKEIRKRSVINKEDVADFIKSPASFINADLVDLDSGFSFRVEGLVEFTRIQNTDIDSTDNDWFLSNESISIDSFENHISSESELEDFQSKALNALENNSSKVLFKGKEFNIPPIHELEERIAVKKEALRFESNDQDESSEIQGATKQYTFAIKYFEENQRIRDLFKKYEMDAEVYNGLTISPYPHQKEASNWIYSLYRSAIQSNQEVSGGVFADDMGLGKTFSSLLGMKAISHYAKSQDQEFTNHLAQTFEKPFLVVAPLSLLENWHSEVHKFLDPLPFRDIVVLNSQSDLHRYRLEKGDEKSQSVSTDGNITAESIQYRLKIGKQFGVERLDIPGRLILITYETLRNYQFSMARIPFSCVIFDEAQKIKNPDALATRAAKALISDVKIIATGTPVENNLDEYWCLMDTANPKLFGAQEIFKDQYSTPLKNSEDDELKLKIGKQLYQASGSFLLRRTKEELKDQLGKGLPEKIEYKGITDDGFSYLQSLDKQLTLQQLEAYDKIRKLRIENPQISSDLQNLHRIKACMLHPRLTFTNRIEHMSEISSKEFWDESAKLMSMYEIIDRVRMKNQKLIVFIISRSVQYLVKRWIKVEFGIDPDIVSGETKVKANDESQTRLGKIDKFSNKDGFNVIILSPLAAGVGLNVTSANHVFHLERHWNPAKEAQANDRVYRIGQTKEVSIYYPIGKHPISESFDIKLDKLLSRKTFIKDALITYPRISEQELAEEFFA